MQDLLTTAEVAERLRVTPETLRLWRHRRSGPPCFKYGRQVVYRVDELEVWLESRRAGQVPA